VSVDRGMQGDRRQREREGESTIERANQKGQVLKDELKVKDKAKRAGSIL